MLRLALLLLALAAVAHPTVLQAQTPTLAFDVGVQENLRVEAGHVWALAVQGSLPLLRNARGDALHLAAYGTAWRSEDSEYVVMCLAITDGPGCGPQQSSHLGLGLGGRLVFVPSRSPLRLFAGLSHQMVRTRNQGTGFVPRPPAEWAHYRAGEVGAAFHVPLWRGLAATATGLLTIPFVSENSRFSTLQRSLRLGVAYELGGR